MDNLGFISQLKSVLIANERGRHGLGENIPVHKTDKKILHLDYINELL